MALNKKKRKKAEGYKYSWDLSPFLGVGLRACSKLHPAYALVFELKTEDAKTFESRPAQPYQPRVSSDFTAFRHRVILHISASPVTAVGVL